MEQVAERGCEVYIVGGIPNLTGHGPGQPAQGDSAGAGRLD